MLWESQIIICNLLWGWFKDFGIWFLYWSLSKCDGHLRKCKFEKMKKAEPLKSSNMHLKSIVHQSFLPSFLLACLPACLLIILRWSCEMIQMTFFFGFWSGNENNSFQKSQRIKIKLNQRGPQICTITPGIFLTLYKVGLETHQLALLWAWVRWILGELWRSLLTKIFCGSLLWF